MDLICAGKTVKTIDFCSKVTKLHLSEMQREREGERRTTRKENTRGQNEEETQAALVFFSFVHVVCRPFQTECVCAHKRARSCCFYFVLF